MPLYNFGNNTNDFGQGFYCCSDSELAKEWACQNRTNGFVNVYEINFEYFNVLDLTSKNYHILNWLALVLNNKHVEERNPSIIKIKEYIKEEFTPDLKKIDVISGIRADNSFFAIIRNFLSGDISLHKFCALVQENNLCNQLVLIGEKAINSLNFKYAQNVECNNYYQKIIDKDLLIQNQLNAKDDNDYIFINDIYNDKWRNNDARLQRMLH